MMYTSLSVGNSLWGVSDCTLNVFIFYNMISQCKTYHIICMPTKEKGMWKSSHFCWCFICINKSETVVAVFIEAFTGKDQNDM